MKQKVGPLIVACALAVLAVVVYFIYRSSNTTVLAAYKQPVWHGPPRPGLPGANQPPAPEPTSLGAKP